MHVGAPLAHATGDRADQRRRVRAVARAFGAGDDDRRGIVGLDAAVQKVQGLHDPAAGEHVVDRDAVLVQRLWVAGRVLAVRDLDHCRLLGPRAVLVHVAHEGRREPLRRAGPAVGLPVQLVASDRRRAPAGAAHAQLAVAVHRPVDHHRAAHARPRSRRSRCRPAPRCSSRRPTRPCRSRGGCRDRSPPPGIAPRPSANTTACRRCRRRAARRRPWRCGSRRWPAPAWSCPRRAHKRSRRRRRSRTGRAGRSGWLRRSRSAWRTGLGRHLVPAFQVDPARARKRDQPVAGLTGE